jgi:hypothetical protein
MSTGAAVSGSSCFCLPGHWGWKRRPFYAFFTPQRFRTAKTLRRHPRFSLQAFIRGLKGFGSPATPPSERDRQRPRTAATPMVGCPGLKRSRQARKSIVGVGEARPHRKHRKAFASA